MADIESPRAPDGKSASKTTARSEVESILSRYTHDEQRIILHNLETLAAMAQYVGQDFQMRVLLNKPGGGWHWNFEKNEVRVDPETLLRDPLDVSKAIYCHEGFHRRITPKDGVPTSEWQEPGLPFLVNSIEDPRIENFGGEAYPAYRPLRAASYRHHYSKAEAAAVDKVGRKPRHIEAGLELIKQWFREAEGKPFELSESLDPAVRKFVEAALPNAQDAWFRYPSKAEADWDPERISAYFADAYRIIRDKVWPEFKKLYEQDRQDQVLDEAMRDLQGEGGGSGAGGSPQQSQEPLTEDEVRELLKAAKEGKLEVSKEAKGGGRPLDLSKLPPELKQEISEFVDGLSQDTKKRLQERGDARLSEASQAASSALEGKEKQSGDSTDSPSKGSTSTTRSTEAAESTSPSDDFAGIDLSALRQHVTIPPEEGKSMREQFRELLNQDLGLYENTVREISPTINQLENDLRAIFQKRRQSHRESGRRSGPSLNINRFIAERASGKPAVETKAFEAKTRPLEKDYAVLLLVDVSGSMRNKIHPAFAATVACTEALSRLKVQHAIYGFNDALHPYKLFDEKTDPIALEKIEGDVGTDAANYNNDGWALQQVAKKLLVAPERERILIVLSDGRPEPSSKYSGDEYDLKKTTSAIEATQKIKLIGLGMGQGTEHVDAFYSKARANIPIEDLPHELSTVLREAIAKE